MSNRLLSIVLVALISFPLRAQSYPFNDRRLSDDERIDNLISLMTLDEKIQSLSYNTSVPRLGVKGASSVEALHGLVLGSPSHPKEAWQHAETTVFPQSYGLGETWDTDLMKRIGEYISYEARYLFQNDSINKGALVLWTPNVDLGRDPRWGRTEECYGEDPYLVGEMGAALIKGLRGEDEYYWRSSALMKHFLANSNEKKRTSTSSNFSDKLFREYYSWGFYKGVTKGGAQSFMTAYNDYNGIGCIMHPVLREIVMKEWGMNGTIITDGGAFTQFMKEHEAYRDSAVAAAACLKAGITRFLDRAEPAVRAALERGLITEREIEDAIRGNFRVMLHLGLMDAPDDKADPYGMIGRDGAPEPWKLETTKQLVREATRKSVVLLKNEGGLLPIDKKKIKKIAVIGERANQVIADWYAGTSSYNITVLDAIKEEAGQDIEVRYVQKNFLDSAVIAAQWADIAIVCVGNHPWGDAAWEQMPVVSEGKEAVDRLSLTLDNEDMVLQVAAANKNTVCLLISSFPYAINRIDATVPSILHVTQCSQELGHGVCDILFGRYSPAGRLTQTWPKSITDLPLMLDFDITGAHDHQGRGRTYMYSKAEPLYSFGYGLSYTDFEYGRIRIEEEKDVVRVIVPVSNTGSVDGEEVVQIYQQLPEGVSRLRGFARVFVAKGKSIEAAIEIERDDLRIWDETEGKFVMPKGAMQFKTGLPGKRLLAISR
ncbi:MAG: glycoside hydrolase family 3 C-terminal domain-containing protein [Marinilabiliaceae bacterium]|nr:glycoside hydrolase family 3 C-terminal domain-containing protein [Marinilabiliaceae bacterium]